jgi:hypothetical protein
MTDTMKKSTSRNDGSAGHDGKRRIVTPVEEVQWGEDRDDHLGYSSESDRITKRGLEDWEMVEKRADDSDHRIPYWFFGLFFVLLVVATGLTFPFWGVRPGFERPWFDWGIPAGIGWVVAMSALIYYMVDYRHMKKKKALEARQDRDDEPR